MDMNRNELRSFYNRMQASQERAQAIDAQLDDTDITDDERIKRLHASGLFEDETLNATKLSRYAQSRGRADRRANLRAIVEEEVESGFQVIGKNPSGNTAKYLRSLFVEALVEKAELEVSSLDIKALSVETARQSKVEQVDRKLEIEERKLAIANEDLDLRVRKFEEQIRAIREKAEQLKEVKAGDTLSEEQISNIRAIFGMTSGDAD